jgi:hypothetical protein
MIVVPYTLNTDRVASGEMSDSVREQVVTVSESRYPGHCVNWGFLQRGKLGLIKRHTWNTSIPFLIPKGSKCLTLLNSLGMTLEPLMNT